MRARLSPRTLLLVCALLLAAVGLAPTSEGAPKPLKVFILAGQSNMQGHAQIRTFAHVGMDPETAPLLKQMQTPDGKPRVCKDVWISSLSRNGEKTGRLTAGFGATQDKIGPEFTFGLRMEETLGEPVLIIKTAWGGKSLHTDFRPPSAGPYVFNDGELARATKQGKDLDELKAKKVEATGHYYRLMIGHVKKVLADIKRVYPGYRAKRGYELAGFVWFQGWNDMVGRDTYPNRDKPGGYDAYSEVLTHFIRDVRKELSAPKLPFVIGVMGAGGPVADYPPKKKRHERVHQGFRDAMAAPAKLDEFQGNVIPVWTETYWDQELGALRAREGEIQQKLKRLRNQGKLTRQEERKAFQEQRANAFTKQELATLEAGVSNAEYHYLGSAKILGRIGVAFADALTGTPPPAPAKALPRATTPNPDFTRGVRPPEEATHDWNLGPTGARGWMYAHKKETSEARQIYITEVAATSPADGVLARGDVLLGIGGKPFAYDPRTEVGLAITAAEAKGGKLRVTRWRAGKTKQVTIKLPTLGAYSDTAPFDCRKSKRIFERGCEALAARMRKDPEAGNPITRSYNALALLASGKRTYLPLVRKQVAWASTYTDPERRTLHAWFYGPVNLLLAEYVLATGDRKHMADLERITMEIVRGQSAVGSWGHRFVQTNGRLAGYGMMNAPGLPLAISLVVAREAGVSDPALDAAIEKSARLVRFYVGKGSIPYGDHRPWIKTHDDNGKNSAAAVLFNLLGDTEAATYFSRMSVASHGPERDQGHTGNFFNMLWALPGVAVAGPQATGAWMDAFGWSYDLARQWDGTYIHQGPPDTKPDKYRGWDSTGAYLLAYAQPLQTLRITGKQPSVAPQLDVATAKQLVEEGRGWSPRQELAGYASRSEKELLAGLGSWSPVVRERSAIELASRKGNPTAKLVARLKAKDLHTRLGACQALAQLKERGADAVPALRKTLEAENLWLRVKAAEALARIGKAAMPAVPDLLTMLAEQDPQADPRGMVQRYLCLALFPRRDGMLGKSLEGVDREALYRAVRAGLGNEDGRARGSLESVYRNLSYEEIKPLLPAILDAVREPSPSGIMFADGIRLAGLEILAKHRIREGVPLCLDVLEPARWSAQKRVKRCLATLRAYGGAARSEIPRLQKLEAELAAKRMKPADIKAFDIPGLIRHIESDAEPAALRSLEQGR